VEVTTVFVLGEEKGKDVGLSPLVTKYNGELFHVVNCGFSYGKDVILHPLQANWTQLLIEERLTKLSC
jgi:hypothetical protein